MNKEVFEKIFKIIEDNQINEKEIKDLVNHLQELDEKYLVETQNRLDIIKSIRNDMNNLNKKTKLFERELFKLELFYAYRDKYIDDYDKVMNLIVSLANEDSKDYALKQVYATQMVDPSDKEAVWYGKTLIILDKRVATALNKYKYKSEELGRLIKSIIDYGYSVVMITQNFCDGRVRPKENSFDDIEYKTIRNGGFAGDISCYLYDSKLKDVIDKLTQYIDEYGPDFTNIDVNTLKEMILSYANNKETSKKLILE